MGLFILFIFTIAGIGYVLWLLKNEKAPSEESVEEVDISELNQSIDPQSQKPPESQTPEEKTQKPKSTNLLKKLNLDKKISETLKKIKIPKQAEALLEKLGLNKFLPKEKPSDAEKPLALNENLILKDFPDEDGMDHSLSNPTEMGTATLKTSPSLEEEGRETLPVKESPTFEPSLSQEEEKKIEKEIELTSDLNELKEKYTNLEKLFDEKSQIAEKSKESLDYELKNRKEFNKVKDLLEKELKDIRDKSKNLKETMH